jgi:hypothetical protein
MRKNKIFNRKGFYPLYTTLGVLLLLMSLIIAFQWQEQESYGFQSHLDRLEYIKINHAVENVKQISTSTLQNALYDALMGIGKFNWETGKNPFLYYGREEGWERIVISLRSRAADNFNDNMKITCDFYDGERFIFAFDEGINITVYPFNESSIRILENGEYIDAVFDMPKMLTSRYGDWEALVPESSFSIPLRVRLKDIYYRAWDFDNSFRDTAEWFITASLYARVYKRVASRDNGAMIKVGDYSFDPTGVLLYGDIETIKDFVGSPSSLLDIGAIPAAAYFAEWTILSEPSLLPPGVDLESQSDIDKLQDSILDRIDFVEEQSDTCNSLTGAERDACESLYDPDVLEQEIEVAEEQLARLEDILDNSRDWIEGNDFTEDLYDFWVRDCKKRQKNCKELETIWERRWCKWRFERDICIERNLRGKGYGFNDWTCEEFRENAVEIIEPLLEHLSTELSSEPTEARNDYVSDIASTAPELYENMEENEQYIGLSQLEEYGEDAYRAKDKLHDIMVSNLLESKMRDRYCRKNEEKGDCTQDCNCEDPDCHTISCRGAKCASGAYEYSCVGDRDLGRERITWCTETDTGKRRKEYVDQCGCRCRASFDLLWEINEALEPTVLALQSTVTGLREDIKARKEMLEVYEKAEGFVDKTENLDGAETRYDVTSKIEVKKVSFDKGELSEGWHFQPEAGYENREEGICGDVLESSLLYGAQIAAASLGNFFTGGALTDIQKRAVEYFPVIIESTVVFKITESIIDDGNRIVLQNIASTDGALGAEGDGRLFTYAPFEFEIYKDMQFELGSKTGNRVIAYVRMSDLAKLPKIYDGLSDCPGAIKIDD